MKKSEWKTPSLEGKGKGDGHQHPRKSRTPSQYLGHSHSEEELGHWTPTGAGPMVIWMDGWYTIVIVILIAHLKAKA